MRFLAACVAAAGIWPGMAAADTLRCPPPGTQVTFSTGVVATYTAPNPGAPALCTWTNRIHSGASWYGIFANSATGRDLGEALANVYAQGVGGQASHEVRVGLEVGWIDSFAFEALEPLPVGGETRQAARIRVEERGVIPNAYAGITHYWIDVQTHAVLRRRFELLRGTMPATALSGPLDVIALRNPAVQ